MTNLLTNQQVSLRDALEIVPHFDGSSKVPLTLFIEACKKAKEMVPNAEANLVIVYYVPRRIMRVITRRAIMLAGDLSQGVIEA